MKKVAIVFLIILLISTSAYAVSLTDTIICKKVVLHLVNRTVLVNRITGEVKYILTTTGTWLLLQGPLKNQYQSMYNAQTAREKS